MTGRYSEKLSYLKASREATLPGIFALLLPCVLGVTPASGQMPMPVPFACGSPFIPGTRIFCSRDADSTRDIDLSVESVDIDTTIADEPGVHAVHRGDGEIRFGLALTVVGEEPVFNFIDTVAERTPGIFAHHFSGNGNIDLDLQGAYITTTGTRAPGIYALHGPLPDTPTAPQNIGNIKIKASGVFINTAGNASYGIHAYHKPETAGKVDLEVVGRITTHGRDAHGVYGWQAGRATGDFWATVRNSVIKTNGQGSYGVFVNHAGTGEATDVVLNVDGGLIRDGGRKSSRHSRLA